MQGCNKFCTYCIVPYVRGRQASRTVQDICGEVRRLAEEGYKEITLLGQNVNSYGLDFRNGTDFADLINSLSEIPGIERIRYMTSHPRDMTFRMVDAMAASPKVVRHMHLPVQHGSNEMLRKMNRGYTIERFFELLEYVREKMPDIAVTTDIITGFPGETENMHQETLSLLKKARFDSAYTFIYSPRTGTPAARMTDQVPEDIKKRRLQELMNTENSISLELNRAMEGHTFRVIAEGPTKNDPEHWFGRTSGNKMIIFPKDKKLEVGMTVSVHVDKAQTWILKGTLTE
jgi:tRNA-2-methylthio-N6-dimethylallyladenosine synthase